MRKFIMIGAAVAVWMGLFGVNAMVAQEGAALNKPLDRFTIGDLIPKVAPGLRETSAAWKKTSDGARAVANSNLVGIKAAMPPVKSHLEQTKSELKAAEKVKDFTAVGAAQGKLKTEQTVLDVLERMQTMASAHDDFAQAWAKAADLMQRFAAADESFDQYRTSGIAKPGTGQPDARLSQAGYKAFKDHSETLKDFGAAFEQLGQKMNALGASRLKFAADLEKGGHIQPGK